MTMRAPRLVLGRIRAGLLLLIQRFGVMAAQSRPAAHPQAEFFFSWDCSSLSERERPALCFANLCRDGGAPAQEIVRKIV